MYQLIRPIRLFFLFFQVAKPVPARDFVPALLLLSLWLGLGLVAQKVDPGFRLSISVASALSLHIGLKLPRIVPRLAIVVGAGAAATLVFLVTAIPLAFLMAAQDTLWAQRVLTILPLGIAAAHVLALSDPSRAIARLIWPDRRLEPMRTGLARLMLLKNLGFALLNEVLILSLPLDLWLVWAALLPAIWHYSTSVLTTAVFVEHDRRRRS